MGPVRRLIGSQWAINLAFTLLRCWRGRRIYFCPDKLARLATESVVYFR
jgi:hypothetical protein